MRDLSLFAAVAVLFFGFCLLTAPEVGQTSESIRWTHRVRSGHLDGLEAPAGEVDDAQVNLPYARFLTAWYRAFGTDGTWLGLRATSALGGAVTAAFFFLIVNHLIKNSPGFNLCCLGLMLASYAVWSYSTEVSPRIWGVAGCAGAFYFLMLYVLKPSWTRLALVAEFWFLGLMLHGSALWFLPVPVLMLWRHEEFVARRLVALVVVVLLPVAGVWATEAISRRLGLDVSVLHVGASLSADSLPRAAVGFFRSIVHGGYVWDRVRPGSAAPPLLKFALIWPVALLAGFLLRTFQVSLADYRDSRGKTREILNGLALWFAMMGLYAVLNQPAAIGSWLPALVPFWVLIVFPFRKPDRSWVSRPRHMALLHGCLALLFVVNLLYDILPRQWPDWYPETRAARQVGQLGSADDLFVVPRGMEDHLAFYAGRTNVVTVDSAGRVSVGHHALIDRCRVVIERGGQVVYCEDVIDGPDGQARVFAALAGRADKHRVTLIDTRDNRPWKLAPVRRLTFYVVRKSRESDSAAKPPLTDSPQATNN